MKPLHSSNGYFAQGGVAAAVSEDDEPALHAVDITGPLTEGRFSG